MGDNPLRLIRRIDRIEATAIGIAGYFDLSIPITEINPLAIVPRTVDTLHNDMINTLHQDNFVIGNPNYPDNASYAHALWASLALVLAGDSLQGTLALLNGARIAYWESGYIRSPGSSKTISYIECKYNNTTGKFYWDQIQNAAVDANEAKWIYLKLLPYDAVIKGSGDEGKKADLVNKLNKWYEARDDHAKAHPVQANGFRDIEACFIHANKNTVAGDPYWWDVSAVKNFASLFEGRKGNFHPNIQHWEVKQVTTMKDMFKESSFNGYLTTWKRTYPEESNLSNVTTMESMFQDANVFNNGDSQFTSTKPLTWDSTTSLTNMKNMFAGVKGTTIFNQILTLDLGKVETMSGLFQKNVDFNQNITNWNVKTVEDMSNMFKGATSFDNGVPVLVNGKETTASLKSRNDIANWNVGGSTVLDYTSMFEFASSFDRMIIKWNVPCSKNPTLTNMVKGSGLAMRDQFDQGFKGLNTPPCTLFNSVRCFNEGTKILCRKNGKEQYILVEDLREGDKVYTENHGYKKIADMRKATVVLNRLADMGLYRMKKRDNMIADLEMTGLHAVLINKDDAKYADDIKRQGGLKNQKFFVDDKFRLRANQCHEFEQMERKEYTIYSFSLETPQQQYGIYANGLLVETTSRIILRISDMEKVSVEKKEEFV